MKDFLIIHPEDNVAVALSPVSQGAEEEIGGAVVSVREDIPFGHKLALRDFKKGDTVFK